MEDSIFFKFATGELRPDTVRYEDEELLAFDDIHPDAPIHILVIPKKPIQSVADMTQEDAAIVGKMILLTKKLAEEMGVAESGYKVTFNVREGGGQIIPYLHLHLLANKP
ncbi:MAG: HIT domain-containing protein [Patescibacteria group bacterium]|nr:HIT domain-containing protein [Patescibacteria group bacterium]